MTLREKPQQPGGAALFDYGIGWIHYQKGNLDRAEAMLRRACQQLAATGNRYAESVVSITLGDVVRTRGRPSEALTLYQDALNVRRFTDAEHISMVMNMALAYLDLEDWREVERYTHRAGELEHPSAKRSHSVILIRGFQALVAARKGNWHAYDNAFDDAKAAWEESTAFELDAFVPLARVAVELARAGEGERVERVKAILEPCWAQVGRGDLYLALLEEIDEVS